MTALAHQSQIFFCELFETPHQRNLGVVVTFARSAFILSTCACLDEGNGMWKQAQRKKSSEAKTVACLSTFDPSHRQEQFSYGSSHLSAKTHPNVRIFYRDFTVSFAGSTDGHPAAVWSFRD